MSMILPRRGNRALFRRLYPEQSYARMSLVMPFIMSRFNRKAWDNYKIFGSISAGLNASECPDLDKIFSVETTKTTKWYQQATIFIYRSPSLGTVALTSHLNCSLNELKQFGGPIHPKISGTNPLIGLLASFQRQGPSPTARLIEAMQEERAVAYPAGYPVMECRRAD